MNWFMNLAMRSKLLLSFGLIVLFLVGMEMNAYTAITNILASEKVIYEKEYATAIDLKDIRSNQNAIQADLVTMLLVTEPADRQVLEQDIKTRSQENTERLTASLDRNPDKPALLLKLKEFDTARTNWRDIRENQIIPLIHTGKIEDAKTFLLGAQAGRQQKLREVADELIAMSETSAQAAVRESERLAEGSTRIFVSAGVATVLVSALIILLMNRIIAAPLQEVTAVATRIAAGDLSVKLVPGERTDEVGALRLAFINMIRSLQEMAGVAEQIAAGNLSVQVNPQSGKDILGMAFAGMIRSLQAMAEVAKQIAASNLRAQVKPQSEKDVLGVAFATMVDNLRRTTSELSEGVSVLVSAASEIVATTTQVASSAAETATAVTETTTTVEEVKKTAQLSSEKALYVSDTAQKAAQVSQSGKRAVEQSIEGINAVRQQMEAIAQSIVKLSEQSQAIGEIIASVNDLAEQSNLLAVNAAIEASKAGEQGKGFTVVAQEIKSLAEQSKQATTQVRAILGDIQKATTAAVLAAEQGSKAVEVGVKQSAESGEAIRALSQSIVEAAQAASQIAASSHQQQVGMDQVALAMDNIRQASAQNAAGTKQAESAAHNLNELGQKLKQLAEQYQM